MHNGLFATTLTAMLITAPALVAQAQAPTTGGSAPSSSGASGTSSGTSSGPGHSGQARPTAMTQDKLRQTLQQAGFQNVQILDASYLVQAKTKDGDPVVMIVNPPAMSGMAGSGSASGSSGASGPAGSGGSGASKP